MDKISTFVLRGHSRSVKIKKNIVILFLLKGINVIVGILMVPMAINYLNPTKYGIWLTLSSIVGWFSFFDIGLGNGLRNKFAEALAANDEILARIYVSTTYAILGGIMILACIVFWSVNPFLNWSSILNASADMHSELSKLAFFVFTFFCLQMMLRLIGTIMIADQEPAKADFFNAASGIISLCIVFTLTRTTNGSILYLGMSVSMVPVIVYLIANVALFLRKYRYYSPSFKYVRLEYAGSLTSLGLQFFFIQIASVILYSTSNIIIAQLMGPAEVTPYNIAYKFFSIVLMIFTIVLTPFWSGFTQAYNKKDFIWIKNVMKKLSHFRMMMIILIIIMVSLSGYIYRYWVGEKVQVPFLLTVLMGFYIFLTIWNVPYVYFLNGVGKIRLQLYVGVCAALINIPLAIYFIRYLNLGISGIVLSICLISIPSAFLWPTQYNKIINDTAHGVWQK